MKRAPVDIPPISKEVVLQAGKLTNPEARFLVSQYYDMQNMRKRADMQIRHLGDKVLPTLLQYTADSAAMIEAQLVKGLKNFAESDPVGLWMLAQDGVGPVIAAGMLAHLDIEKAPTAGHFWSFAGLDPTRKWEKGQKRPWNADMKQLCYHLGECAKRISWKEDAFYGRFYLERKKLIEERNATGGYAERAKTFFTKSAEWKKVLEESKLPAGNLDRQACNITAKIFLSHLHAVMYWNRYHRAPAKPFAIAVLGHAHEVRIPKIEMFPGLAEAYYGDPLDVAKVV